ATVWRCAARDWILFLALKLLIWIRLGYGVVGHQRNARKNYKTLIPATHRRISPVKARCRKTPWLQRDSTWPPSRHLYSSFAPGGLMLKLLRSGPLNYEKSLMRTCRRTLWLKVCHWLLRYRRLLYQMTACWPLPLRVHV